MLNRDANAAANILACGSAVRDERDRPLALRRGQPKVPLPDMKLEDAEAAIDLAAAITLIWLWMWLLYGL